MKRVIVACPICGKPVPMIRDDGPREPWRPFYARYASECPGHIQDLARYREQLAALAEAMPA